MVVAPGDTGTIVDVETLRWEVRVELRRGGGRFGRGTLV